MPVRTQLSISVSLYAQPFDGPALRAGVCRCHCDRFFFAFDRWTRRSALSGVLPRVQAASSCVYLGATVPDRRPWRRRRRQRPTRPRTVPPRPAQAAGGFAPGRPGRRRSTAAAARPGGRARRGDWRNGDRSEDQLECPPAGQHDATSSCSCCCCCPDPDEKVETSQARARSPSPPPSPPPASRRFETETTAACTSRRRFASCPGPAKASLAPRRERQDLRGGRSLRRTVRRGRRRRVEGQSPEEVVSDTRRRGEACPILVLEYVAAKLSAT